MMDEAWISMVRLAKQIGDISSLFPTGITRLYDLPYTIHNAILAALAFISFDELPEKEKPPRRIWLDGEKMEAWWDEVKRIRDAELQGHGDQSGMSKNALAEQMLGGLDGRS